MEGRPPESWTTHTESAASGAIIYWFRPTATPQGGAPLEIREQWIGTPLPVRAPRPAEGPESYIGIDVVDRTVRHPIPDGVAVAPLDAIAALDYFGQCDAASWWRQMLTRRPATRSFVFRRAEGEFLPPLLAYMLHPELADFVGQCALDDPG
jgi:hypothetical protein